MLSDYHIHTYFSDDSQCLMEEMVQRAIVLGFAEIAFTEHVDYGKPIKDRQRRWFQTILHL